MAFIIGSYNRWDKWDREHAVYKFKLHDWWYAIKEIDLQWGLPELPMRVDDDDMPESYYIYEKYEDALEYVKQLKEINART